MVVLQICAFAPPTPGNFVSSVTCLEDLLKSKGVDTIYAFPERARDKEWCKEIQKRTKVYFLPEAHARVRIDTYRILKRIYQENEVGIVHSHFELYDIPATVMAPKTARVFWHLHNAIQEGYSGASFSRKLLMKWQYKYFGKKAKLLSVSEKHGEFAAKLGFKKDNIEYMPNGLDLSRIDTDLIDSTQNEKQLLMFGRDVYRKGVDLIVEAAKKMSAYNMQIKIVGQDACQRFLLENNAPKSIVFSRPMRNVNELYKEASAFLHISRSEGQAYALLEAIYAGLPIICSDIPENLFAKEFRNIFWIKDGSIEDLIEVLHVVCDETKVVSGEDKEFNRDLLKRKYSLNTWVNSMMSYYMI